MKTNENNARDAYRNRANDIARLMDVLQMELEKHASAARADPGNWARAGDLDKVRGDLIDLVGSISGTSREQIEAFLAE